MACLPHDFDPHNFKMLQDAAREHVAEEVQDEQRAAFAAKIGTNYQAENSGGATTGRERMEALLRKRNAMPAAESSSASRRRNERGVLSSAQSRPCR